MTAARLLIAFSLFWVSQQTSSRQKDSLMVSIQDLCWSYDGSALYFSAMRVKSNYADYHPGKWSIYKYDVRAKVVTKLVDSALNVAASPTGYVIAVGKLHDGNRDIYLMDDDGQNARRVTADSAEDFGPSFSPDGKKIAFNSRRDGNPEIYVINSDGTGLKQITVSKGYRSYNPAWSPDGAHIVYYLEKGDHKDQIHVMNADGSGDADITADTLNNFFPGWIDKDRIIYGSGTATTPTITFTINQDGSNKRPLSGIGSFYARYSPDGMMIACVDTKEHCIRILTPEGVEIDHCTMP